MTMNERLDKIYVYDDDGGRKNRLVVFYNYTDVETGSNAQETLDLIEKKETGDVKSSASNSSVQHETNSTKSSYCDHVAEVQGLEPWALGFGDHYLYSLKWHR